MKQENSEIGKKVLTDGLDQCTHAAACVHYVAGLAKNPAKQANKHRKVVRMLQAAAFVHYVAGFTNRYRKVVRMLQAAGCVHYVAGQLI